jgi:biotin-[acetyl-CoA-carboxylase] ligase BirA-like protein
MARNQVELWTDDPEYASRFFSCIEVDNPDKFVPADPIPGDPLFQNIFGNRLFYIYKGRIETKGWRLGCIVKNAPQSHFDLLIKLGREGLSLPTPLFCIAGSSKHCHGQRNRPWVALEGNLHMAVLLTPKKEIENFGPGFLSLAAISMVEALDELDGFEGRAGIKWVNDILIDGAKVAGFLVHTISTGNLVQAVILGIGLNIETSPILTPDPFIPCATSLKELAPGDTGLSRRNVVLPLLKKLDSNYRRLLEGKAADLIEGYRRRSVIIGKKGKVLSDPIKIGGKKEIYASGVVEGIGPHLELFFHGLKKPVTQGRLIILD